MHITLRASRMLSIATIALQVGCISIPPHRVVPTNMSRTTLDDEDEALALYLALLSDDVDAVAWALRQGINPDLRIALSGKGSGPPDDPLLCVAASAGSARSVELLLSAGADPYIRDSIGFLPIERAINGRSARWADAAHLLAQDPPDVPPDELQELHIVTILGRCMGYFPPQEAEVYRQAGQPFRVFVNGQRIGTRALQQKLAGLGIPVKLSPPNVDEGRVIEIGMTPDGPSAFDCTVRVAVAPLSGSSKWGRLEQRYGYWLFQITRSVDH